MDVDMRQVGVLIAVAGGLALVGGIVLALGGRLPFGRLPGDLSGGDGSVRWSVPLGTSLLLSLVLTVVINLVIRR